MRMPVDVLAQVDMRLDVLGAGDWLPDWVKDELLTQQRSRINTDGELVVTSQVRSLEIGQYWFGHCDWGCLRDVSVRVTEWLCSQRMRSQASNREDALGKLRQFVAQAAFVPPPPSAEKARKVARLARRCA